MDRQKRNTWILVGVVVILGLAAVAEQARERRTAPKPLLGASLRDVNTIALDCPGCPPRRFERVQGAWQMTQPYDAPADPAAVARILQLPRAPVAMRYPVEHFDLAKIGLEKPMLAARDGRSFAAAPLLRSGEHSWNETGQVADSIRYDAGGNEIPGPHDLALALTRLSPRPDREQQRVIVTGDADFLANSYLGNGGNRALGLRFANWLVGDDALVDVAPVEVPDRLLALSPRATAWIALGLLVGLPLILLATGVAIAWRRRRR